jgi:hypothetical protein
MVVQINIHQHHIVNFLGLIKLLAGPTSIALLAGRTGAIIALLVLVR